MNSFTDCLTDCFYELLMGEVKHLWRHQRIFVSLKYVRIYKMAECPGLTLYVSELNKWRKGREERMQDPKIPH